MVCWCFSPISVILASSSACHLFSHSRGSLPTCVHSWPSRRVSPGQRLRGFSRSLPPLPWQVRERPRPVACRLTAHLYVSSGVDLIACPGGERNAQAARPDPFLLHCRSAARSVVSCFANTDRDSRILAGAPLFARGHGMRNRGSTPAMSGPRYFPSRK